MTTVAVLFFGVIGVGLRYVSDLLISVTVFPLSTFLVNIIGCFIAGILFSSGTNLRTPLMLGLCGGLTTFSALIVQCLQMIREGDIVKAMTYLLASQIAGLFAAWLGMKLSAG